MKIEKIVIGAYQENCYLLETDNKYLLVDPGEGLDKILEFINGKDIVGILITHGHNDHIASLDEIVNKFKIIQDNYIRKCFLCKKADRFFVIR